MTADLHLKKEPHYEPCDEHLRLPPVAFVRGLGVWLWDDAGRKYADALSGISFNTLGHNHPRLVRALTEQISRDIHTSYLLFLTDSGPGLDVTAIVRRHTGPMEQ